MSCAPHRPWLLISSVAAYLDLSGCQGQGIPRSTNTASSENFRCLDLQNSFGKEQRLRTGKAILSWEMDPSNAEIEKSNLTVFDWSEHILCFTSMFLSHWLTVSKKSVNRSVLNSWKNEAVDLESGSYFIHLLFLWSFIHFYFHQKNARWFSFRTTVVFYESFTQLPCSFFVPRNTSLSTDPATPPVLSRVEPPNHRIANLNETTNVISPENSGISAEKSWLEDGISFWNGPFSGGHVKFRGGNYHCSQLPSPCNLQKRNFD